MKLHIFTLVLDGAPWIYHHLPVFNALPEWIDWKWIIVEGVSAPVKDTSWCKPIAPRLSKDGTHEYLTKISNHPKIRHVAKEIWNGKTEMCNMALSIIGNDPGILLQVDSDELWTALQIETLCRIMEKKPTGHATFYCRYFVGPNIYVEWIPGTWTNHHQMWERSFRYEPGMEFETHEPPVLKGCTDCVLKQDETRKMGLVFQHYAYALKEQVEFKETYYGYAGAVEGWKRLQGNQKWPARLAEFFPWIKDNTMANQLYEYK